MAGQIEASITVNGDHSVAVVRMGAARGSRRALGRSRTVRIGVGRDALAGLSLSSALLMLSEGMRACALQRGGDRVRVAPDSGEAPEPRTGLRGEGWTQPTLDL